MVASPVENHTPFAFEQLALVDKDARPLMVLVIKATYKINQNHGILEPAEDQVPIDVDGMTWGQSEISSYKYEPETAFIKPSTDIVLIGHAQAQRHGETKMEVTMHVGPVIKLVQVVGDRLWYKSLGLVTMTKPKPIDRIPLIYELAFGGWDRSDPDPDNHTFEPRNPVGTGFRSKKSKFKEGIRLPNLEDPRHPLRSYKARPSPAGFGFISPHWEPRVTYAGTYDQNWMQTRMPCLPKDFNPRFFNAAPADQIAPYYLKGDEQVLIKGVSRQGSLSFNLPGVPPPVCLLVVKHLEDTVCKTQLDTVIINTDENLVLLIWRANLVLKDGPQDVTSIEIQPNGVKYHI